MNVKAAAKEAMRQKRARNTCTRSKQCSPKVTVKYLAFDCRAKKLQHRDNGKSRFDKHQCIIKKLQMYAVQAREMLTFSSVYLQGKRFQRARYFSACNFHNLIRATLYLMTTLKLDMKRKNIYLGVSKFSRQQNKIKYSVTENESAHCSHC